MRRLAVPIAFGVLAMLVLPPLVHAAHAAPANAADCADAFSEYQGRGWLWMYLASFGFGFLTSLTPCVYPMIPITLAIFGARGGDVSRRRAMALASVYVIGMGLTYATLGVTVALLGKTGSFGTQLGSPYVVVPIVILFLVLAASLFGAFELQLPSSIQLRLNQVGGKGFGGAFAMGLVGGLIAAPCTGPFLLGLLTFVATTHDVVGGGSLLFIYALGMGVLFFALAAFAMALPKSGAWMEHGKSIGGMLLVFAGVYFLRPLVPVVEEHVPADAWVGVVAGLAIVIGVALGAVHKSFHGGTGERVRKAFGVALVVVGASGLWMWYDAPRQVLPYVYDEQVAFDTARAQGKGVMIDFGAAWCGPCRKIERTFGYDDVYAAITTSFVPLKVDTTDPEDERSNALKDKYRAYGLPNVIFVSADANELLTIKEEVTQAEMLKRVQTSTRALHGEVVAKCD